MKMLLLSQSDIIGGAARAAYRLHKALQQFGVESQMKVRVKASDDWTIEGSPNAARMGLDKLRAPLGTLPFRLQQTANTILHSGNWFPSRWARQINVSTADVVNLHWVGAETLSIEEIGRIDKPLVWTFHDMWPFCGAEHYTTDDAFARWRTGYTSANCLPFDRGIDLDRIVWWRKHRAWKQPIHIVTPSQWLADCVSESALMRDWPVTVIPNVLDTAVYQPLERNFCRNALGLPQDKRIILFGAIGGSKDSRKGFDLLFNALESLAKQIDPKNLLFVIFGQSKPEKPIGLPMSTHWLGHVQDDVSLALLYNAADVMVVPSRQENLPQTCTEAQACGTPVVAFNCTGFPDAVEHQVTGYLAEPYLSKDLANGILWLLEDSSRLAQLRATARERAIRLWSSAVVIPQYLNLYKSVVA